MDATNQRMLDLINTFPAIKRRGGLHRWDPAFIVDPDGLLDYYGPLSSGERHVIDFALMVWDRTEDWGKFGFRRFHVAYAARIWDPEHLDVFIRWLRDPYLA